MMSKKKHIIGKNKGKFRLKNLKIGRKLALSFAIVLILSSIASGNALYNLKRAGKSVDDLYMGSYQVTNQIKDIDKEVKTISEQFYKGFARNEYESTNLIILNSFKNINEKVEVINNNPQIEDSMKEEVAILQNNLLQLQDEYKKIYQVTQSKDFSGLLKDVNINGFNKLFTSCEKMSQDIYEESEQITKEHHDEVVEFVKKSNIKVGFFTNASIVLGILITWYMSRNLRKPLEEIEIAANKMSKGDFDIDITYESKDELGKLSDSMRKMSQNINLIIKDTVIVLEKVSNGNFDVEPEAEYVGIFEYIEKSLNKITNDLSDTILQINESSNEVQATSQQVASGAQMLSQGTTEQAAAIEELSATITEISDKINNTAKNASQANILSESASNEVREGNEQMIQMVKSMTDISNASKEIGRIIKTIDDIAFQTNILALNAAVEAGKGFAVVAYEVRNLAAKSAEAAKNTSTLIENSIAAVHNGSQIVDNTALSLQRIVDTTNQTIELIDEIAKETNAQSSSILQVSLGIEQISQVVQTNSATSEESAAASEELSGQAQMLKLLIDKFNLKNKNDNNSEVSSFN